MKLIEEFKQFWSEQLPKELHCTMEGCRFSWSHDKYSS